METIEEYRNYYHFSDKEILSALTNIKKKADNTELSVKKIYDIKPEVSYSWDDKGFSALFSDLSHEVCRYNATAKEWYFFDGVRWISDTGAMRVLQRAKSFADDMVKYCADIHDERTRADYLTAVKKYGMLRQRETLIKDSRDKYFVSQTDFDRDKDLLNCQNVTLNLKTGEWAAHNSDNLLSKVCNVHYDPDAKSELWESFINNVMQGDKSKIDYLQKIIGYSLTAETSLECCFILYGSTTRNGKSTLVETLTNMLGDYAVSMQPQTLAQKQNKDTRQASGDIARLYGCRFLTASEPPKRMIFDAALLKTLLGRDSITARNLYEKEFTFTPEFKLFINTNYLPLIQDDTLFTSQRINVITFDRHFSESEQDRTLKERLCTKENLSGILNWCLEGLRKFRAEGAAPPEAVRRATKDYRDNSDKFETFIAEELVKADDNCLAGRAYERYKLWCVDNGYGIENKRNFFEELNRKNIFAKKGRVLGMTRANVIIGYKLRINEEHYYEENRLK